MIAALPHHGDDSPVQDHRDRLPPAGRPPRLSKLRATLGHDLEVGASQLGRGAFQTALFSADDGTMFLATSPIGFVVALAEPQVSLQSVRTALAEAVGLIEAAWSESARPPSP